jgi:predicted HTH domain antitoxin
MTDVTFEVRVSPDLLNFGLTQDQVQQNVREWLVLSLFTDGVISSGKAAKLLGITRPDFLTLLRKRGIAYIDYSPEELQDEFAAVRQLELGKTP